MAWFTKGCIKKAVKEAISELSGDDNPAKIVKLNEQIENLKLTKRMEELEIKHLIKMEQEKNAIELQKEKLSIQSEKLKLQGEFKEKEMVLQNNYHTKTLELLREKEERLDKIYTSIMACLPNVNVDIKKKISE